MKLVLGEGTLSFHFAPVFCVTNAEVPYPPKGRLAFAATLPFARASAGSPA